MSPEKKRRRKSAKPERTARKQSVPSGNIRRAAALLGEQSSQLLALALLIDEQSLGEIEIDGVGLCDRGVDEIDRYLDNLQKGIAKARREKGRSSS